MHLSGLKYMASSMVDPLLKFLCPPWNFFVPPFRHVPPTSFSEKTVPPNPILTSYKLWKSILLNNYNIIWCFHFWRVLLVIINPFFMSLWLLDFVPLYTLIHFSKIDMITKISGGFIRFPTHPHCLEWGDDAIHEMSGLKWTGSGTV